MIIASHAIKYTVVGSVAVGVPVVAALSEGMVAAIIAGAATLITALSIGIVNIIKALAEMKKTLAEVKQYTNGQMGLQKAKLALATAQLAAKPDASQKDLEKADAAKVDLAAHKADEVKVEKEKRGRP